MKLTQSVSEAPVEHQVPPRDNSEEDGIADLIARMKLTLAANGDKGLDAPGKFFDWMSCHPGHSFHPVIHPDISRA